MKYLYYIYQILFALPILLLATIITATATIVGSALGFARFWAFWPAKIWSWLIIRILLLPVHIEGQENVDEQTSYVFVANHQGYFDIFLIYAFLGNTFRWMMKKSLRKIPLVGKACESGGQIFVDKSGPKAIKRTYDKAREILRGGVSVVVFPEGSRTFTGCMGYFKKGAFQLADELQLPVVPITINGPFDVLPRTAKIPLIHWHPLSIKFHKPIPPQGKGKEFELQTLEAAYEAVRNGLPTERQKYVQNDDQ